MTKARDNFNESTRRAIAIRAGYRCSVCNKATAGPKFGNPDGVVVDGEAAHITAAACKGPRYDVSLTVEQRRSAENGIWACRKHARLIDSDECRYSADDLRLLKEGREREAQRERDAEQTGQVVAGGTARLIELPDISDEYALFDLLQPQPYTYSTTSTFRQVLHFAKGPERIVALGAKMLPEIWQSHANLAGILSTALSTNLWLWRPSSALLGKLAALCEAEIHDDRWSRVAAVEPLAFALGAKGRWEVHRSVLSAVVGSEHWRNADAERIAKYYGSYGAELVGIERHLRDPLRHGLLKANDVARLIHLLGSDIADIGRPATRRKVVRLLQENVRILEECGEENLAREASIVLEADRQRSGDERA